MKLIIGLGNPGQKYGGTRHNAGFAAVEALEKKSPEWLVLAKSDNFMNLSGSTAKKSMKKYGLRAKDLIVAHDDIDIPLGEFKIQKGRGAAGHKGVQSIIDALGTKDFWRVRVGICPKDGKPKNVERFVLQRFTDKEKKVLEKNIPRIVDLLKSKNLNQKE